jgi:hypothetical protein
VGDVGVKWLAIDSKDLVSFTKSSISAPEKPKTAQQHGTSPKVK